MASGPFTVPVLYSSVDKLLDECKKDKKLKTFFLEKNAKKIGDNKLYLLPLYSITEKRLGLDGKPISFDKERTMISFENEYVKYDVTPKKDRKYEPFIVISEYFNGSGSLHIKSKLFELVQYVETQFKRQTDKFIKEGYLVEKGKKREKDSIRIDSSNFISPIVRGTSGNYIRLKLKFDKNNRLDSKVKDYSKVPFIPFANKDGEELNEDNCEKIEAGDLISGLVSLESVYCSPSGISLPLKIVSLKVRSLDFPEDKKEEKYNSDSDESKYEYDDFPTHLVTGHGGKLI